MTLLHNRKSIRLPGYDYCQPGAYFITLCVKGRNHLFGEIRSGKMHLNDYGQIVQIHWKWLEEQYRYIKLDEFVVMPNHFHGILWIRDIGIDDDFHSDNSGNLPFRAGDPQIAPKDASSPRTVGSRTASADQTTPTDASNERTGGSRTASAIKIKPLGRLIGAFKTVSTKELNMLRNTIGEPLWQRDFYEHIGRNEKDLIRIRNYIRNNPRRWSADEENTKISSPRYIAMPNPQRR